jgi:hypothetical protein
VRDRATRAAAFRQGRAFLAPRRRDPVDPFDDLDKAEQQAAGGGVGLVEPDLHPVTQAEGLAGALADQHLAALVVAEELLAQAA